MKAALIIIAASFCFGVTQASAAKIVTCPSLYPRYEFPLQERGTTCRVARDLDRYAATHDFVILNIPGHKLDGYQWRAGISSRAHGHTYFRFTSGLRTVWITDRGEVS